MSQKRISKSKKPTKKKKSSLKSTHEYVSKKMGTYYPILAKPPMNWEIQGAHLNMSIPKLIEEVKTFQKYLSRLIDNYRFYEDFVQKGGTIPKSAIAKSIRQVKQELLSIESAINRKRYAKGLSPKTIGGFVDLSSALAGRKKYKTWYEVMGTSNAEVTGGLSSGHETIIYGTNKKSEAEAFFKKIPSAQYIQIYEGSGLPSRTLQPGLESKITRRGKKFIQAYLGAWHKKEAEKCVAGFKKDGIDALTISPMKKGWFIFIEEK